MIRRHSWFPGFLIRFLCVLCVLCGESFAQTASVTVDGNGNVLNSKPTNFPSNQLKSNGSTLETLLGAKANDSAVVHNTGNETIAGTKTFSTLPVWPNQSANFVFAGPSSGGAAAPGFRSIVANDIPALQNINGTLNWSQIAVPNASNAIFVSQATGNDSNSGDLLGGRKLTLASAKAAATSGKTIAVLDGTFNERNLAKDGVNWFFFPGAGIAYTGSAAGGIFDDSATGTNGPVAFTISGSGKFTSTGTGANPNSIIEETNASSNITFDGNSAKSINTSGGVATTLDLLNGKFLSHFHTLDLQGNGLFASTVHWRLGESQINADEIIASASTNPQYTFCVWTDPASAPTGQLYLNANVIRNYETSTGQHRAVYVTGDSTQRVWINANQIFGPNSDDGRAVSASAGFVYVVAEKVHGTVENTNGGILYATLQKLSGLSATANPLLWIGARAYINIDEYDDSAMQAGPAIVATTSGAELHLNNPAINRAVNGDAISAAGGTVYANGGVINTQLGYYDIRQTSPGAIYAAGTKYNLAKVLGNVLISDPVLADHATVVLPVLANPAAPQTISGGGLPGGSNTVGYKIVARGADGTTTAASVEGTYATAPATWASPQKIVVFWNAVPGAVSYDVYRTTAPIATGKIVSATTNTQINDVGTTLTPTGSVPTAGNTTGGIVARKTETFSRLADVPAGPTTGFRLFSDNSDRPSFENTGGFLGAFDLSGLTASRTLTFPDQSGTLALTADLANFQSQYQSVTVSSAGNTNSNSTVNSHTAYLTANAGAGAYTATFSIPTAGRAAGDRESVHLHYAASTNPTIEIHNSTSGGTLLFTWTGDGAVTDILAEMRFDGASWYIHDAHFVW